MLVRYWHLSALIFPLRIPDINYLRELALVAAYFGLNIAAIIGFIQLKTWRTLIASIAIIFTTIFFSAEYIPFASQFVAEPYRFMAMIIGNLLILFIIVGLRRQRG
jgi:hypothetical protein